MGKNKKVLIAIMFVSLIILTGYTNKNSYNDILKEYEKNGFVADANLLAASGNVTMKDITNLQTDLDKKIQQSNTEVEQLVQKANGYNIDTSSIITDDMNYSQKTTALNERITLKENEIRDAQIREEQRIAEEQRVAEELRLAEAQRLNSVPNPDSQSSASYPNGGHQYPKNHVNDDYQNHPNDVNHQSDPSHVAGNHQGHENDPNHVAGNYQDHQNDPNYVPDNYQNHKNKSESGHRR